MSVTVRHRVTFPFRVDEPSINGRIYTKEVVEKAVEAFNNKTNLRKMVFLRYPDESFDSNVDLTKLIGHIDGIFIDTDNNIVAYVDILYGIPATSNFEDAFEFGGFLKANPWMTGLPVYGDDGYQYVSDVDIVSLNVYISYDNIGEMYSHTVKIV